MIPYLICRIGWLLLLPLVFLSLSCTSAKTRIQVAGEVQPAVNGAVASDHPAATGVGLAILEKGGNAYDAAVAVQFALAVAYPGAGNIGGGGFAIVRTAEGEVTALDFREMAPAHADRKMYLDPDGDIIPRASLDGHLAVGVPGSVDGMARLHHRFGRLDWQEVLQPAIKLARYGFALTQRQADKLNRYRDKIVDLNRVPPPLVRFDRPWREGDRVFQNDLAATLERIGEQGRAGFYSGETARRLVGEMNRGRGLIRQEDLDAYRSVWRTPVTGNYRGYRIVSMPPPSSGGIALLQILYGLEAWPLAKWSSGDWRRIHVMTEIERLVYADRAEHLGDPDYYPVPIAKLLSDGYLQRRFANVSLQYRTASADIGPGLFSGPESNETTHFSIVDREGNAISVTTTLNGSFGSKVMVEGAGFFLNNEMDDFSSKPGVPNQFGLVGDEANAIVPGKRMLSSMTPTIVEKEGELFLVLGSPGGSTIITTVAQVISHVIDSELELTDAVSAPRVHHQWLPDVIYHEPDALSIDTIVALTDLGHELKQRSQIGRVNAVQVLPDGRYLGVHDAKRGDGAAGGY